MQLIELSERLSELRLMDEGSDALSIHYGLATPVTLVSRRDAQMVPVIHHASPAKFYHVAVPILTTSVFREAEFVNATSRDLLGGQINIFLDGEFKGRTDISSIASGRSAPTPTMCATKNPKASCVGIWKFPPDPLRNPRRPPMPTRWNSTKA